jgi:hypothetical protein
VPYSPDSSIFRPSLLWRQSHQFQHPSRAADNSRHFIATTLLPGASRGNVIYRQLEYGWMCPQCQGGVGLETFLARRGGQIIINFNIRTSDLAHCSLLKSSSQGSKLLTCKLQRTPVIALLKSLSTIQVMERRTQYSGIVHLSSVLSGRHLSQRIVPHEADL